MAANATRNDLEKLQEIQDDDALSDRAFGLRVVLRDRTAVRGLIDRINQDPGRWCRFAPALFSLAGVGEAFENNLELAFQSGGVFGPHAVPLHLSADQLVGLLERHASLFKKYPRVWAALWRSNVPEALGFVTGAIAESVSGPTEEFLYYFGWPYPVSRKMLNALIPVMDRFPGTNDVISLGHLAMRAGERDWVRAYVLPRLPPKERSQWIDSDRGLQILDQLAGAAAGGHLAPLEGRDPEFCGRY